MKRKTIGLLFVVLTFITIFIVAVNAQVWDNPNGKVNFGHTHNWTTLANFPAACSAGQFVSGVNSSLTCAIPTIGTDNDWSGAGTGQMFTTNLNDKVGIGTSNPTTRLEVATSGNEIASLIGEPNGGLFRLQIAPGIGTPTSRFGILFGSFGEGLRIGNNGQGPLHFETGSTSFGTDPTPRMTIIHNGNVGIGTQAPQSKLHIQGRVRVTELPLDNNLNSVVVADADGVLHTRDATINIVMNVNTTNSKPIVFLFICLPQKFF